MDESRRDVADSGVFNNPEDSDIILQLREHKIYAHRVILRIWSPFFRRVFHSRLPVATSPVFALDDEDDLEAITTMLKHMYYMSYDKHSDDRLVSSTATTSQLVQELKFHHVVYIVSDKYDCPAVREKALGHFKRVRTTLEISGNIHSLITSISKICGSDAPRLADQALYNATLTYCAIHIRKLVQSVVFIRGVKEGSVFDDDSLTKLQLKLTSLSPGTANWLEIMLGEGCLSVD